MTLSTLRVGLLSALVSAVGLLAGCPPPAGGPDAGPGQVCSASSRPCDNDRTCGGGFCDKVNDDDIPEAEDTLGCCVQLVCLSNADCQDNETCDVRRGLCVPEGLCDPAAEQGGTCKIDGVDQPCCGSGELCTYVDGLPVCTDTPTPAADCFISAGGRPIAAADGDTEALPAVTRSGEAIQLEAVGTDGTGKNVPHAVFTWTGDGVDANGVLTSTCATGVCAVTVTAASGGATCDGIVRVYAPPAQAQRIVVLDLATGEPLSGIDVAATIAGVPTPGTTDANGAAEFATAADAVSAFPDTHQWHTIVAPPADVIVYTAKLPNENKVAGLKGTFNFDNVSTTGDIKLGLAGTAIASSITDLNFATLIGDIADYNVELEGLTDQGGQLVPLPSGLVIALGDQPIKGDYVTFGEPGKNIAWAIGGQVALAKVGPIISSVSASDDVNIGSILGGVLPFFSTFDHAVVTGLDLAEGNRPAEPADDQPVPFGDWPFAEQEIAPNTLLSLSAPYTMPDLPCTPGGFAAGGCTAPAGAESAFATGAVLLSGVVVPGVGLVPLGLTAGLDDPDSEDGQDQTDGQLDTASDAAGAPGKGVAIIDYAPPHDGLEGNLFVSVAIALDLNSLASTDSNGFGASIITHVARKFDPTNNTFPQEFLDSPGGSFTPGADGSFTIAPTGDDADFWRVNFDDGSDVEWNVWFADEAASFSPGDFHPNAAEAAARFTHADVQAFKLGTGYEAISSVSPATFDDLFGFDGANVDNLLYYLGAWASEACKFEGHCTDTAASAP